MTNATTTTSAQQFIKEMAEYTGENFFQDVAYGFDINDEATDAADKGTNTAIIFADNSAVWFDESENRTWKKRDLNDFVFAFQIVDGVQRSETIYVPVVAQYGKFVGYDEDAIREACEEYAKSYDKNGDEDWTVCQTDDNEENNYSFREFRFAFDGADNFEWNTSREYVTY